jgi:tetratricopeptide (TPR) repeat protein
VSPRARVFLVVGVAAVLFAAATVGITLLTSDGGADERAAPRGRLCPRGPPLELDLGVRRDREAVALRRATELYGRGERARARRTFSRYRSLPARVGAAVAGSPQRRLAALRALSTSHPRAAVVHLNLGHVLVCGGRLEEARRQWRIAEGAEPDSFYAVRAADRLHPELVPGLPIFVPSFPFPRRLSRLSPARQLAALSRQARRRNVRAKLLYGVALQRLGHPLSAARVYADAAALAPANADAQVAAAVGRFDKEQPARAFSRLGPLVRTFPRAATVRFHLGLLLLWIGRVDEGKRQLARAARQAPSTRLSREARRFLLRLESVGPNPRTTRTERTER